MTTEKPSLRDMVQNLATRAIQARLAQQRTFLHKLIDASVGRCPDCGESIPDCWEQIVAQTLDTTNLTILTIIGGCAVGSLAPSVDWIGMRATCSGAETWLRLESLV